MTSPLRESAANCLLTVRLHPGARRNTLDGTHNGALKISLTAPPVDGKANAALIDFLANALDLTRSHVELITGATSRTKTLRLTGITAAEIRSRLAPHLA